MPAGQGDAGGARGVGAGCERLPGLVSSVQGNRTGNVAARWGLRERGCSVLQLLARVRRASGGG